MPARTQAVAHPDPSAALDGFLAKFTPEIAAQAHAILKRMRKLVPGATELVYDNYNALAIGFSPSERTSDGIFSIAVYPRWVSLFFLKGVGLLDPENLLKGSGTRVRHIVLHDAKDLQQPGILALMDRAMLNANPPFAPKAPRKIIVKSVSAKQRPRRPE